MKLTNNSLKYFIFIFIVLLILIFLVFFFSGKISLTGAAHFNLNTPYIKAVVQSGESVTIPITITNIDKDQNFSISYKKGSTDFIRLGNNDLMIQAQEGEYFNVHLNGSLPKGIYVSSISVKGGDEEI